MGLSFMDYVLNNAKHFGSFGSDLPSSYLAPIITEEHAPENNYTPAEVITKLPEFINDVREVGDMFVGGSENNPTSRPYRPSASGFTPTKKQEIEYINAELAKHYGMSKATAYQEALSNTAYQRSVQDMKSAGLNPSVLFGSGRVTPASASIYASEERSGGGGSRRRYGSRSSGNGKLFSSGLYYGISTAVGLATAVLTKNPANYWIGSAGAQGVMGAMNSAWKK